MMGTSKNRSERLSSKAHGAQKVRHTLQGRRAFEHRNTHSFVSVAVFLLLCNTLFQTTDTQQFSRAVGYWKLPYITHARIYR